MVVGTQPRILIAQVPECNVLDYVLMLAEDLEQTSILILLQSLHISRLWLSLTT